MIPYRSQQLMAVPKILETRIEIMRAVHKLMAELATDAGVQKFDPDQPRVPAGNPDGGQWTDGATIDVQSIVATARRLNVAAAPDAYQRCLDLCYPLLERFEPPWSDRNTWDFHKCMNACLGRNL